MTVPRSDPKNYGKPRKRFRSDAPPQPISSKLQARLDCYNSEGAYKGHSHPKADQGYNKPGSQK